MLKSPPQTTSSSGKSPLRRASYVTIDKLVNSQYIFDLNKFNEELHKVRLVEDSTDNADDTKAVVVVDPDNKDNVNSTESSAAVATDGVASLNIQEKTNTEANTAATSAANAWSNPLSALPSTWQQQQQQSSQVLPPSNNNNNCFKFPNQSNRLQPPRDGFNLCVLVGKVDVVVDKLRVDGSRVHVAEVQVGDHTGSISLRARDEQIDMLMQVSKDKGAVVLRNCTVELHQRKYLRLAVSKWGKMKAYPDGIASTPDPPLSMNEERNFSLVDLNLVATSKENILPNQSSSASSSHQQPGLKHQDHRHQQHHQGGGYRFDASLGSGYQYQNHSNRKYQNQRRQQQQHQQQPSMYSPQRGGYHHHQQHYYQPYAGVGDANNIYSYQSHSTEQSSHSSRGGGQQQQQQQQQHWSHHHSPYRNDDQYNQRQQQQQLMYQQYELQQRHAHQMQMLQETQRRLIAVEQQRMGHPQGGVNMVESHDGSSEEYSVSSSIAVASRGSFPPPPPPPPPPMGYPYSPVSSPMMSMLLPGVEQGSGQHHQGQQQQEQQALGLHGSSNDATVVSPPNSPVRQGTHPVGYGDPCKNSL